MNFQWTTQVKIKAAPAWLALTCFVVLAGDAKAQSHCDCSVKVDSCQASIALDKQSFKITSNLPQCSKIEWVLDGKPKTNIVTDGNTSEARPNGKAPSDFWLKSCTVCADTKFPTGAKSRATEKPTGDATLLGKWCSKGEKDEESHTVTREGVSTKLAFGRLGRKYDKFSCNSSLTECVGEIHGMKKLLAGDRTVINFRYTYSLKDPKSATLATDQISAADDKVAGTTTTALTRCD